MPTLISYALEGPGSIPDNAIVFPTPSTPKLAPTPQTIQ